MIQPITSQLRTLREESSQNKICEGILAIKNLREASRSLAKCPKVLREGTSRYIKKRLNTLSSFTRQKGYKVAGADTSCRQRSEGQLLVLHLTPTLQLVIIFLCLEILSCFKYQMKLLFGVRPYCVLYSKVVKKIDLRPLS